MYDEDLIIILCSKYKCSNISIPNGKYCEEHKTKPRKNCKHNKRKSYCKECNGNQFCKHNKRKSNCKECGGTQICKHNKLKYRCKECRGGSICEHNRIKSGCKECVGGSICIHKKRKSICKECVGKQICKHDKIRTICKKCGGGSICEHNRIKSKCKECDFIGYLTNTIRSRIYTALTYDKELHSTEYLGCDIETFKSHIEKQFKEGMSWDNHGEWHIDHIIPIKYKENQELILENIIDRLHYTNTQPMWADENISKGNRYIG